MSPEEEKKIYVEARFVLQVSNKVYQCYQKHLWIIIYIKFKNYNV
jgi:hypothetical protein